MNSRKVFQILAGLFITALAVYFFVRHIDPGQVLPALKRIDFVTVLLGIFFSIFTLYLRGLRWRFLLPDDPKAEKRGLFALSAIGFMANQLLPARLGEAARVYLVYKRNRYSMHASIGSVLAERIVDTFFYALFILTPYFLHREFFAGKSILNGFPFHGLVQFCLLLVGGAFLLLILSAILRPRLSRIEARVVARFSFLAGAVRHVSLLFAESTDFLKSPRKWAAVILLSPLTLGCYALVLWLITRSLGLSLSPLNALLVAGFLALGAAIPSSPGYIGTLHVACMEALILLGIDNNNAAAVAILYHLVTWVATVAVGLFFVFRTGLRLGDIRKMEKLHPQ